MYFRLSLLIITSSINTLQSMEQTKPIIHAELMINENDTKYAAYGSKELHETIHAAGIITHPFDILIPVKTKPAVPGMPHHLPIKEIELCSTGSRLPFILNGQQIILTCADNPASKFSFEQHCQKHIELFNQKLNFAYSTSYSKEYANLRDSLIQNNLIKRTITRKGYTTIIHFTHHNFKPYTTTPITPKTLTNRQIMPKQRLTSFKK